MTKVHVLPPFTPCFWTLIFSKISQALSKNAKFSKTLSKKFAFFESIVPKKEAFFAFWTKKNQIFEKTRNFLFSRSICSKCHSISIQNTVKSVEKTPKLELKETKVWVQNSIFRKILEKRKAFWLNSKRFQNKTLQKIFRKLSRIWKKIASTLQFLLPFWQSKLFNRTSKTNLPYALHTCSVSEDDRGSRS